MERGIEYMAKKQSNQVVIFAAIISFVIGFIFSAVAVIYLSIPASFVIPETQTTHRNNMVVSGAFDVDVIKDQDLSIHFLELGNKYTGDCTLIKVGDTEILIDAGSRADSVPVIQTYLNQYVTDHTLEYVIVTHAHQDHIAGFATSENVDSLFDLFSVENVIQFDKHIKNTVVYQNYCREIEDLKTTGTNVYTASECINQNYNLGHNVELQILDQKYYYETANNENNHSVCCQIIQNHQKYYLFTGDLEKEGELSLIDRNQGKLHRVELYKAGHHGSKTSSSADLLEIIKPKVVCVCCCAGSSEYTKNNLNQFPTQEFINRVAPYTNKIYVTTLCIDYKAGIYTSMNGNIVIYCKQTDENVTVACANNNIVLKDTDWFKANRTLLST